MAITTKKADGGKTLPRGPYKVRLSLVERILRNIEQSPDGCWLWTAYVARDGYGRIKDRRGGTLAHRAAYTELVGPIPSGLTLDHLCRRPRCVNPAHLEPVTDLENRRRGNGIGVRNAAKTHCPSGHPYSPENTYRTRIGRRCKICTLAGKKRSIQRGN